MTTEEELDEIERAEGKEEEDEDFMPFEEARRELDVSTRTLRTWISSKSIRSKRKGTRVFCNREDVETEKKTRAPNVTEALQRTLAATQNHATQLAKQQQDLIAPVTEAGKTLLSLLSEELERARKRIDELERKLDEAAKAREDNLDRQMERDLATLETVRNQERKDKAIKEGLDWVKLALANTKISRVLKNLTQEELALVEMVSSSETVEQLKQIKRTLDGADKAAVEEVDRQRKEKENVEEGTNEERDATPREEQGS